MHAIPTSSKIEVESSQDPDASNLGNSMGLVYTDDTMVASRFCTPPPVLESRLGYGGIREAPPIYNLTNTSTNEPSVDCRRIRYLYDVVGM